MLDIELVTWCMFSGVSSAFRRVRASSVHSGPRYARLAIALSFPLQNGETPILHKWVRPLLAFLITYYRRCLLRLVGNDLSVTQGDHPPCVSRDHGVVSHHRESLLELVIELAHQLDDL